MPKSAHWLLISSCTLLLLVLAGICITRQKPVLNESSVGFQDQDSLGNITINSGRDGESADIGVKSSLIDSEGDIISGDSSGIAEKFAKNRSLDKNSGISLLVVYKCGPDLCFQIKAMDENNSTIEIIGGTYSLNNTSVEIAGWDGNINGPSCSDGPVLAPGETCFGKVLDKLCKNGDFFEVRIGSGFKSSGLLSECY